jgi:hypothetical protein
MPNALDATVSVLASPWFARVVKIARECIDMAVENDGRDRVYFSLPRWLELVETRMHTHADRDQTGGFEVCPAELARLLWLVINPNPAGRTFADLPVAY